MSDLPKDLDMAVPVSNNDTSSTTSSVNLTPLVQAALLSLDRKTQNLRSAAAKIMSLAKEAHIEIAELEAKLTVERYARDENSEYDADGEGIDGEHVVVEEIGEKGAEEKVGQEGFAEGPNAQAKGVRGDEQSKSGAAVGADATVTVKDSGQVKGGVGSDNQPRLELPREPRVEKWKSTTVEKNKLRELEARHKHDSAGSYQASNDLEIPAHGLIQAREPNSGIHLVEWHAATLKRLIKDKLGWDDARLAEWLSAHAEFFMLQRLVGDLLGWSETDVERRLREEEQLALRRFRS